MDSIVIRCTLKRSAVLIFGLVSLAHCSLVRPYKITARTEALFPPTSSVAIIRERPRQDYLVLAEFVGREPAACPEGMDFCVLRQKARAMGANAIWIQKHTFRQTPGDWIYTNGRLVRIYPATYETYLGILIRYK